MSEASGWPLGSQWVAYATFVASFIASGWLVRSQWVAFADFISFVYSASGWLSQFLFLFPFLPVGGFLVASGWLRLRF